MLIPHRNYARSHIGLVLGMKCHLLPSRPQQHFSLVFRAAVWLFQWLLFIRRVRLFVCADKRLFCSRNFHGRVNANGGELLAKLMTSRLFFCTGVNRKTPEPGIKFLLESKKVYFLLTVWSTLKCIHLQGQVSLLEILPTLATTNKLSIR